MHPRSKTGTVPPNRTMAPGRVAARAVCRLPCEIVDQPRSRRAAKPADDPDVPAPAPPLDETDPELDELPVRQAVGARSGEPLFSPEEAARFRAAAADVSSLRLGPPM